MKLYHSLFVRSFVSKCQKFVYSQIFLIVGMYPRGNVAEGRGVVWGMGGYHECRVVGVECLKGRVVCDSGEIRSISMCVTPLWFGVEPLAKTLVAYPVVDSADDDFDTCLGLPVCEKRLPDMMLKGSVTHV